MPGPSPRPGVYLLCGNRRGVTLARRLIPSGLRADRTAKTPIGLRNAQQEKGEFAMSGRTGVVFCCLAFLFSPAFAAAAAEPHADELSSIEWRDCAGHFFFLSRMLGSEEGGQQMAEQLNAWGLMAVYAGETKAKAEAAAGQTSDGLGKSIEDPASGQLKVNMEAMVTEHQGKAEAQGRDTYVQSYAAKCSGPITAYSKRFTESVEQPAQ